MIEGHDFYYYNVIPPVVSLRIKRLCRAKCTKSRVIYKQHHVARMYMEDSEVVEALDDYSDRGFDDLPSWLRIELQSRNLSFDTRQPASYERQVTVADHIEHRVMNKELTMQDHLDKLKSEMYNE